MMIGYAGMGFRLTICWRRRWWRSWDPFARILSPATEESKSLLKIFLSLILLPKVLLKQWPAGRWPGWKSLSELQTVVMTFVAIIALINRYNRWVSEAGLVMVILPLRAFSAGFWLPLRGSWALTGRMLHWQEVWLVRSWQLTNLLLISIFHLFYSPGSTLDVKTTQLFLFALCGFANFGSIGVVVGAFSAISPQSVHPEIAITGHALAAATLSNLMSATIAGFRWAGIKIQSRVLPRDVLTDIARYERKVLGYWCWCWRVTVLHMPSQSEHFPRNYPSRKL